MSSVGLSNTAEHWVSDTCQRLRTDKWDCNRPVCIDMSPGWMPKFREPDLLSILEALTRNKSARAVQLKNTAAKSSLSSRVEKALLNMLREKQSLRSLTVENVSLPYCFFQGISQLEEVAMEHCTLDQISTMALAGMMKHSLALKALKFSHVVFQDGTLFREILSAISESTIGARLERFELSNANLSKENQVELLASIATITSLTSVNLDNMHLGVTQAPQLAAMLQNKQHLKSLSLRANELNAKSIEILLREGLNNLSSLEHLSLAYNPIGDDGAAHLSRWLTEETRPQRSLQSLDLEHSEIWHRGCLALAKALQRATCPLEGLDMDGNDIEYCAAELLQSVRLNMTVSHISGTAALALSDDESTESSRTKQWKQLECLLRLHRVNQRLSPPVRLPLWPYVLERWSKDVDILFFLLSQNPEIAQDSK